MAEVQESIDMSEWQKNRKIKQLEERIREIHTSPIGVVRMETQSVDSMEKCGEIADEMDY